jgi:hypothetical protein
MGKHLFWRMADGAVFSRIANGQLEIFRNNFKNKPKL